MDLAKFKYTLHHPTWSWFSINQFLNKWCVMPFQAHITTSQLKFRHAWHTHEGFNWRIWDFIYHRPWVGLPGILYFMGCPIFGGLCPASRKELSRDAFCPRILAFPVSNFKALDKLFYFILVLAISLIKLSLYYSVNIYFNNCCCFLIDAKQDEK